jgi:hypothetical protein
MRDACACLQSPINLGSLATASALPLGTAVSVEHRTKWALGALPSNGSNIVVKNTGHSVQLTWPAGTHTEFTPHVDVIVQGVCIAVH